MSCDLRCFGVLVTFLTPRYLACVNNKDEVTVVVMGLEQKK